ncbi:MAG: winged helix-turn-helix domain-containing protein [Myxococcota bacterium]
MSLEVGEPGRTLALTTCTVDLLTATVVRDGASVSLTTREVDLLRFLVANREQVVSRDQILADVFGYSDEVVSRACDNTVRRLRAKIEADAADPDHLLTVHGSGYRFVVDAGAPVHAPPAEVPERPVVALGAIRVDVPRRRLLRPDGELGLSEPEGILLDALVRADGRVVERQTLIREVWGERTAGSNRLLDNVMSGLRAKIELDPSEPRYLHTARGTGYRLERSELRDDPDLFGRDTLVGACLDAMASTPWVLLIGPPGVGKSRLAHHLSARADRAVIWVDGTAARSVQEGAGALAAALGLELAGADPLEVVRRSLASRSRALVVLDNLEAAPEAFATLLAALVRASPGVKWLGTSRIRLGVPDERVVEVGPLGIDAAVAMFVRRAAAAGPGTPALDPRLPALRQLVERLDRLPLAIELAAPRLRVLSIDQLSARLDVDLLVRAHPIDERHRSLRAAIGTSLRGLSEPDLIGLQQISLFSRGLFVDDAEGLFGDRAIDLLQTLRDHSLVYLVPDDTGLRFATWHAVRELLAAERDPDAVRRHCRWLGRRGKLDRPANGPAAAARDRALVQEDVAATRMAVELADGALAAGCAVAAARTLGAAGAFDAGLALVGEVLKLSMPPLERGSLLVYQGCLLLQAGRLAEATTALRLALGVAEEHGLVLVEMTAASSLSFVAERDGDRAAHRSWLVRAAEAGGRGGFSRATVYLAEIARADGDHELADARCAEALETSTDPQMRSQMLQQLAGSCRRVGRLSQASDHLRRAHAVMDEHGRTNGLRPIVADLADLACALGDLETVERWVAIGLEIGVDYPSRHAELHLRALRAVGRVWQGVDPSADLAIADALAAGASPGDQARVAEVHAQRCTWAGDPDRLAVVGARAIERFGAAGDPANAAYAERHLARVRLAQGDRAGARFHAERAWAGVRPAGAFAVSVVACLQAELAETGREVWLDRARAASPEAVAASGTELRWALDRVGA